MITPLLAGVGLIVRGPGMLIVNIEITTAAGHRGIMVAIGLFLLVLIFVIILTLRASVSS